MRPKNISLHIFVIILIFIIHLSFLSNIPFLLTNFHLILATLIIILILKKFTLALCYSISLGFLLDIFLFSSFNYYTVILTLLTIIGIYIRENFFINKDLYASLMLNVIMSASYIILIKINQHILLKNFQFITIFNNNFFISLMNLIFLNLIFIFLILLIINFLSRDAKPVFLR